MWLSDKGERLTTLCHAVSGVRVPRTINPPTSATSSSCFEVTLCMYTHFEVVHIKLRIYANTNLISIYRTKEMSGALTVLPNAASNTNTTCLGGLRCMIIIDAWSREWLLWSWLSPIFLINKRVASESTSFLIIWWKRRNVGKWRSISPVTVSVIINSVIVISTCELYWRLFAQRAQTWICLSVNS